jgi:hypothetical protein
MSADDRRRANLTAALGFLRLAPTEPELQLLHRWLDTCLPPQSFSGHPYWGA